MSQTIETLLRHGGAGIDLVAWNQIVASLPRRGRRSLEVRLAGANRTLASLRLSERSERRMLQLAHEKLEIGSEAEAKVGSPSAAMAELALEVETHVTNLKTIEQQIVLVRLAIEHLNRRTSGWANRQGKDASVRSPRTADDEVDRANVHLQRGFAAVHAIRALRETRNSAGVTL